MTKSYKPKQVNVKKLLTYLKLENGDINIEKNKKYIRRITKA